ncbi:uncharacterized protein BP5553_04043 [Venustampulla echinocandica]|uniref:Iron-sulfur cluster assembly factor IBA57 homolog, mitochondrial n=1 Tax=Venustampulla echinocandica TaxID=2656787 RepID=A0A370TVZ4_9HELO|nr:uncharacterized protein BP5553_04043 [Venustampulla echinocandica]RDL39703.1 hypothetical protein BP5553_04043 [Venustampulla echinocandica]
MKPSGITLPRIVVSSPYICQSCQFLSIRGRRTSIPKSARFASTSAPTRNPPSPPSAGYASLPSRRLVSVSGPDSTHFLQGVITANISPGTPYKSGFYAAFLNAQSRILNDVIIYPDGKGADSWLIEVDAKEVERFAKHIKRFKLRAKFDVRVIPEGEQSVWSLWGAGMGLDGDNLKEGFVGYVDTRAPDMGTRLILPAGKAPEVDVQQCDESVYRVRRYLMGVAEGQDELIRESALPQESNIDYMGGIDYRKGCYVGQELTIRTHHTGVVRKRILPVMLYGMDQEMPKALVYDPDVDLGVEGIARETNIARFNQRGRSAGKWLTGVGNIGLGLCRLETMTDVHVQGEAGGYKEGNEFKLEWVPEGGDTQNVKIKAFVPSWHLNRK